MKRIKIVCEICGSDNVVKDAYARWSVELQDWELGSVYDDAVCENDQPGGCNGETRNLEEIEIEDEPKGLHLTTPSSLEIYHTEVNKDENG